MAASDADAERALRALCERARALASRARLLRRLQTAMTPDYFTADELARVGDALCEAETEHARLTERLSSKMRTYEHETRRLREALAHRARVIDEAFATESAEGSDVAEVMDLFASEHRQLTRRLEESTRSLVAE